MFLEVLQTMDKKVYDELGWAIYQAMSLPIFGLLSDAIEADGVYWGRQLEEHCCRLLSVNKSPSFGFCLL